MKKIDSLCFGRAVFDGKKYWIRDVLIFPDGTVKRRKLSRWGKNHHKIVKEDIIDLVSAGADTVVIGTGQYGRAKVSEDAHNYATETQLELVDLPSGQAMIRFNQLNGLGKSVGAIIHMMC